tara:strand:- start:1295 stop:1462 length:168 start_codon:yes stop_codon:yes gene_type:complete
MKVKAKSPIPPSESCKGLNTEDWEKLNAGEEVELDEIPEPAKPYLDIPKKIKKDK